MTKSDAAAMVETREAEPAEASNSVEVLGHLGLEAGAPAEYLKHKNTSQRPWN